MLDDTGLRVMQLRAAGLWALAWRLLPQLLPKLGEWLWGIVTKTEILKGPGGGEEKASTAASSDPMLAASGSAGKLILDVVVGLINNVWGHLWGDKLKEAEGAGESPFSLWLKDFLS